MEKYHHLLLHERIELKLCLEQGETLRGVARRIDGGTGRFWPRRPGHAARGPSVIAPYAGWNCRGTGATGCRLLISAKPR